MSGTLYFGDNLDWLPKIKTESVDLIYLDPPFNSKTSYNIFYKSPVGDPADAQIKAFDDTWKWESGAELALDRVRETNIETFKILMALKGFLGTSDVMAYLAMMSVRLVEMHRVLKDTGSLYLHCDSTASHYLKIILDGIFGADRFRNEIIWKRTTTHNDSQTWSRVADTILFYTKGTSFTWKIPREQYSDDYLASKYTHDDGDGRRYMLDNMTSPSPRPNMMYEWKGFPWPQKGWRYSTETMARLDGEGRIYYPMFPSGAYDTSKRPRLKRYLDEMEGGVMGAIWTDIAPLNSQAQERLRYPTQKPLALLERIIKASSNPGDLVLDPFCGCGTTVHAAETMDRHWIGVDITYLAIQVIEDRLKTWTKNAKYTIDGIPISDADGRALAKLKPYAFQTWAVSRVGGQSRGRGADRGIDGEIAYLVGAREYGRAIISVKAGHHVNPDMIRSLKGVVERENANMGVFICVDAPSREMRLEAATGGLTDLPSGKRQRIQIVTLSDLISGPNLGIVTQMNTIQSAVIAKTEERRRGAAPPSPAELRESPRLTLAIKGGRKQDRQQTLPLPENLLTEGRGPVRRRRGA